MAKRGGGTRAANSSSASASRVSGATLTGSGWSSAVHSAQSKLNDYLLNGTAPRANQMYGLPVGNGINVEVRNHKSDTSDSINDNYVTLQIVQDGNVIASEQRHYGVSPLDWVKPTTATDTMRTFYRRNSHLFDEIRYRY